MHQTTNDDSHQSAHGTNGYAAPSDNDATTETKKARRKLSTGEKLDRLASSGRAQLERLRAREVRARAELERIVEERIEQEEALRAIFEAERHRQPELRASSTNGEAYVPVAE